MRQTFPRYFLYGEPQRDAAADFLHLEDLDERSRPGGWNIRPHAHAMLAHLFFISSGGGHMSADGAASRFAAPALLLIPPRVVHAFGWQPDTQGHVLTLSATFLGRLQARTPELAGLFDSPAHISVSAGPLDADAIGHVLARIERELSWSAPARERALEACLTTLLLDALRLHLSVDEPVRQTPRPGTRLASRFVAALEAEFCRPRSMSSYADALGAEPPVLRAATRALTGRSPSTLLRDRRVLEAKRLLLYSDISVSEAAYTLGFEDPAYFSRIFRNATGSSPRAYRRNHAALTTIQENLQPVIVVDNNRHVGG